MHDYYAILRIARTASEKEIKSAYRSVALRLHPDVNGGDEKLTNQFKLATEAYQVLSDSFSRKGYDQSLGIRHVDNFYYTNHSTTRQKGMDDNAPGFDFSRKFDPREKIKVKPPPPGFGKVFDHDEWNAYHYGIGGTPEDAPGVRRKNTGAFMHIKENERGAQFFIRQKTRNANREGSNNVDYSNKKFEKDTIKSRVEERRMKRNIERAAAAARALRGEQDVSGSSPSSSCTVS